MSSILVRDVQLADIPAMAKVEQEVWGPLGAPVFGEEVLRMWYEERSPFFLVAGDAEISGHCFGRIVTFSPDSVEVFTDPSHMNGQGVSNHRYDPSGNAVYGISIVSKESGVGQLLKDEFYRRLESLGVPYYVGFTRLSGFAAYVELVRQANEGRLPYPLDDIALSYAHESAAMLQMKEWEGSTTRPLLPGLPALPKPDRVLGFHAKGTNFALVSVVPEYMPDPASLNYGAFVASVRPHR